MGNGVSNEEFERQGKLLGVKSVPGKPSQKFKPLSIKRMKEIQKQIIFEYPYLTNVFESILVTDNELPDCPIVWANDQFERMTLYPKEDIIGRNCRFLQGNYTDPATVGKIRAAVKGGESLDVEILNYRRDGTAFWNRFRILPVHKKGKKEGPVSHFIAIQKDVTLLKDFASRETSTWSPPEVAMWLQANVLGQFGRAFVVQGITGARLLEMEREDLFAKVGMEMTKKEKAQIWQLVSELQQNGQEVVQHTAKKMKEKAGHPDYHAPTHDDVSDEVPDFWNMEQTQGDYMMPVKCYVEGYEPVIFLIKRLITYKELNKKIERTFGRPMDISFVEDDEENQVKEDDDVEAAILLAEGGTVCLKVARPRKKKSVVSKAKAKMLDALPVAVLLTDAFGEVMFANQSALLMVGESSRAALVKRMTNIKDLVTGEDIAKIENIHLSSREGEGYSVELARGQKKVTLFATKDDKGRLVFTLLKKRYELFKDRKQE
ncbi:SAM domain (Sterile alpha motif) domain containing protein [Acanthamoeba castellanii str. Neff]|uniref:SAM domain (Sterile alpha motif) domain containing protein n=1 Tax=Acanthamoeba castellanii (strain ATCC 30010 / Neff) TaxID=1257118 RepID=L8H2M3_ACACF|nr:SAM domain (Sterile alpha motif) domain containing protein [Acanthamoeba castellanii str. Neff]ELR19492.1 SAM domain (Sterile alpha motif) domain containing protein [Acanthamoeba castellanii str. Neff]